VKGRRETPEQKNKLPHPGFGENGKKVGKPVEGKIAQQKAVCVPV